MSRHLLKCAPHLQTLTRTAHLHEFLWCWAWMTMDAHSSQALEAWI